MDIGSRLRSAREAKGVSLEALSKITRVKPTVLKALENNDAAAIPPRPYGRGFVSAYASYVGLDPQQTVRDYFLQFAAPPAAPRPEPPVQPAVWSAPAFGRPSALHCCRAAGHLLFRRPRPRLREPRKLQSRYPRR
jgi:transcriptional regulator with XRE-family HTH domain